MPTTQERIDAFEAKLAAKLGLPPGSDSPSWEAAEALLDQQPSGGLNQDWPMISLYLTALTDLRRQLAQEQHA